MKFTAITSVLVALSTITAVAFAHDKGGPDANRDGKITLEEHRAAGKEFFKRVDADNNGIITKAEADSARAKGAEKFKERAEERFAERDTNKNGKLERSEVSRMPDERFKALDTNKDGALTKEEMKAGFEAHHKDKGREGHDPFTEADANKDGQVTAAEAATAADARFKAMDKNGDGVLSEDERPSHGRGHHGEKGACGPKGKASGRPA